MKQLTSEELKIWTKGGNIEDDIYFVIIKTPNCPKCEKLMQKSEVFGKILLNMGTYIYKPGPDSVIVADIFTNLGLTSAPAIIYRYKDNNEWKLAEIDSDDIDDLQCIFDAINDNDYKFFGFNEYGEPVEEVPNFTMNRLLKLIYGEVSQDILKERALLKEETN